DAHNAALVNRVTNVGPGLTTEAGDRIDAGRWNGARSGRVEDRAGRKGASESICFGARLVEDLFLEVREFAAGHGCGRHGAGLHGLLANQRALIIAEEE